MTCYHAIDGIFDNTQELRSVFKKSPLISHTISRTSLLSWCRRKHHLSNKCITSKSALITFIWIFILGVMFGTVYHILLLPKLHKSFYNWDPVVAYAVMAIILCFYPLAGCLADLKFGRYKTITRSVYMLMIVLFVAIAYLVSWMIVTNNSAKKSVSKQYNLIICLGSPWIVMIVIIIISIDANIIQFGIDQLQDSPSDHQNLFILWNMCAWEAGYLISHIFSRTFKAIVNSLAMNLKDSLLTVTTIMLMNSIVMTTLYITHKKKAWFSIDSARSNPYKLVYKVTQFARQHKVPVNRSAFTYCEDEIPSGLDLAKTKYGGPFTMEQVEDVKAFYGIIKIMLAMGPVFFLDMATNYLLGKYYSHTQHSIEGFLKELDNYLLQDGVLLSVLIIILISTFIILCRPIVYNYIPGSLKCIGLGIILMLISLVSIFVLDTTAHLRQKDSTLCLLKTAPNITHNSLSENGLVLIAPYFIAACYLPLIRIGLYEFICAQSPHSMKGVLIGLSFAIKGAFQLFGIVIVSIFAKFSSSKIPELLSCGMKYYLMNICICIFTIIIYTIAARQYKYRLRDEPCHVRRYVEDYYSKVQENRLQSYSEYVEP